MHTEIRERLIEAARIRGNTLGAQYISNELFLGFDMTRKQDKKRFYEIVRDITLKEHKDGRPMIGSLVLIKQRGKTIPEFYKLCEDLGLGDKKELERDKDFIKNLRLECHKFWGTEENYNKYR